MNPIEFRCIEQPSDLPGRYIVFTGGLIAEQAHTSDVPLKVLEVRPTTNVAGKPGHVVFCEDWRGDIIRFTFSKIRQDAGIVDSLHDWFESACQEDSNGQAECLRIRKELAREKLKRLRQVEIEDILPEWTKWARQALRHYREEK